MSSIEQFALANSAVVNAVSFSWNDTCVSYSAVGIGTWNSYCNKYLVWCGVNTWTLIYRIMLTCAAERSIILCVNINPNLYCLLHVYYWRHHECNGRGCAQTVEVSQRTIEIEKVAIRRYLLLLQLNSLLHLLRVWKLYLAQLDNRVSSKLNVLNITIRSINTTLFKYYKNREIFVFS